MSARNDGWDAVEDAVRRLRALYCTTRNVSKRNGIGSKIECFHFPSLKSIANLSINLLIRDNHALRIRTYISDRTPHRALKQISKTHQGFQGPFASVPLKMSTSPSSLTSNTSSVLAPNCSTKYIPGSLVNTIPALSLVSTFPWFR